MKHPPKVRIFIFIFHFMPSFDVIRKKYGRVCLVQKRATRTVHGTAYKAWRNLVTVAVSFLDSYFSQPKRACKKYFLRTKLFFEREY